MFKSTLALKIFATTVGLFLLVFYLSTTAVSVAALACLVCAAIFWLENDFSLIKRVYAGLVHLYADIENENEDGKNANG